MHVKHRKENDKTPQYQQTTWRSYISKWITAQSKPCHPTSACKAPVCQATTPERCRGIADFFKFFYMCLYVFAEQRSLKQKQQHVSSIPNNTIHHNNNTRITVALRWLSFKWFCDKTSDDHNKYIGFFSVLSFCRFGFLSFFFCCDFIPSAWITNFNGS